MMEQMREVWRGGNFPERLFLVWAALVVPPLFLITTLAFWMLAVQVVVSVFGVS